MASLLSPAPFSIKFSFFCSSSSYSRLSVTSGSANPLRFSVSAAAELKKTPSSKRTPKPTKPFSPETTSTTIATDAEETPTAASPVSVPHKKVLVPIGFGTEEMEAVILVEVLRRAGAEVTVASVEPQLEIKASWGTKLVADTCISTCSDQIFDLVALPGGMPGSARLRDCKILREITIKQAEASRLYGAICAAPAVTLLPWGLLERKNSTCHPAFMSKLPTFWAVKSNIKVSNGLTTSRGPGTSYEFALCLVDQLFGESVAKELGASLLLHTAASDLRKEEFNEEEWSIGIHPRVLIPVANGSEGIEVVTIADVLKRARVEVTIASLEKSLQIVTSQGTKIVADKLMKNAAESVYDLILLPGGSAGAERLQKSRILKKLLKEQQSAGRIYGAVCSSPAVLHKHGLLKDKRATAHPSVVSSITDKEVNGTKVVIDGKLITSRGLATVTYFAMAIVSKLFGHGRATNMAEGLVLELPRN